MEIIIIKIMGLIIQFLRGNMLKQRYSSLLNNVEFVINMPSYHASTELNALNTITF